MATTASVGFLTPTSAPIAYDAELLDLLQPILVGIGGYDDPSMVRPGWQYPDTPLLPGYSANWLAFRIPRMRPDTFAYEGHVDSGQGYSVVESTEEIDLLMSFYGPKAQGYAKRMRDGFQLGQNRFPLQQLKIDVLAVGEPATLPALLTGQFQIRVDMTVTLRRYTSETYDVLTVIDLPKPALSTEPGFLDNGIYRTKLSPKA